VKRGKEVAKEKDMITVETDRLKVNLYEVLIKLILKI